MDMAEVKAFNAELSALYDNKPPISKAKMSAITRGAIKAIKFYKHVVHSVEKFILKCKPEYKIPGLYVIDSIVRQSRHQFGADKDFFAPRFAKNMQQTFINLLRCPPEDKRNVIRVLNLWQKNSVFTPEVIQPLFDMVDPNHPIHQELLSQQIPNHPNGSMASGNNADSKNSPALASQHTPTVTPNPDQSGKLDAGIIAQIRQIQSLFREVEPAAAGGGAPPSGPQPVAQPVNFNRRLLNLDFEYDSEEEGAAADNSPPPQMHHAPHQHQQTMQPMQSSYMHPQDALGSILTNPEILRQLQSIQAQMMVANFPMQGMNLNMNMGQDMNYVDTSQPPPAIHNKADEAAGGTSPLMDEVNNESDIEFVDDAGPPVIEIDGNDSRSPSPKSNRRRRSRSRGRTRRSRSRSRRGTKSRSRDRDRDRDRRRRVSRERSRERNIREKPRDREKDKEKEKEREKEKEKERERRKKGLPPIKKDNLSVCSTTLWVGHLSKLVQGEELSDAFGGIGDVISIDLVPPRGCAFIVMNRRSDASRAISKLNKHKMHSKAITVAWAPGKGVKGREWKDFWEADAGACYVPWVRLPSSTQQLEGFAVLDSLEEGGVLDEETVPPWLQRKGLLLDNRPKVLPELSTLPPGMLAPTNHPPGMMVMSPMPPPQNSMGVDTTCLPPPLGSLGFAPHPALPLTMPLLGFKPTAQPGLQQALHLQAVLAHQHQQQQQQQLAHQILLGPPPPRMPPHLAHTLPHTLPLPLSHQLTMPPSLPILETRQDDAMELDPVEDMLPSISQESTKSDDPPHTVPLSDQLKALLSNPPPSFSIPPPALPPANKSLLGQPPPIGNHTNTSLPPPPVSGVTSAPEGQNNTPDNKDRDKRDRDGRRDRDRRDRDRDRTRDRHDRDRDRERGGERDRERCDRDKERERDRGIPAAPDRERGPLPIGERDKLDKERERGGDKDRDRDRERDRAGRERGNRWGGRGDHRAGSRERSPGGLGRQGERGGGPGNAGSLQDRLWEMANGPGKRPHPRDGSPSRHSRNDRQPSAKDDPSADGLLGEGPPDMERRKGPSGDDQMNQGRSPLPPMAPFRIGGRDEMRMRGMGPRGGPMGSMRPGMWTDGPAPFGPRFNGGPPFDRPPFDGPPFDRPNFDEGPPFDGPPFDRPYDGPSFDRQFDRPPFDGPIFDGPQFDRPPFDGPPDAFFDRAAPPRGPRGLRASSDARRGRGERDSDREGRPRSSRWTGNESPDRNAKTKQSKESSPKRDDTKLYGDENVIDLDKQPDYQDEPIILSEPQAMEANVSTKQTADIDQDVISELPKEPVSHEPSNKEENDCNSTNLKATSNFDMFSNDGAHPDTGSIRKKDEDSDKNDSIKEREFSSNTDLSMDKEVTGNQEMSQEQESSNNLDPYKNEDTSNNQEISNEQDIPGMREILNNQESTNYLESLSKEKFSEPLIDRNDTNNEVSLAVESDYSKPVEFPGASESFKEKESLFNSEFSNIRETSEKLDIPDEKDYGNVSLPSDSISNVDTYKEKESFSNMDDRLMGDIGFSTNDVVPEMRDETNLPVGLLEKGDSMEGISEGGRGTPCRDEVAGNISCSTSAEVESSGVMNPNAVGSEVSSTSSP